MNTDLNRLWALPTALVLALAGCGASDKDDTDDTDVADTDDTTTDTGTDTGADTSDTGTASNSIADIVTATPRFSILLAAVVKADLVAALDNVTVFAPNDTAFQAAFTALGVTGVDDLSKDQLTAILTYHVLAGEVDSTAATAVANGEGTTTALGGTLDLSIDGTSLKVDDATVIAADIQADNGIIHEIDAVMLPNIVDVVTSDAALQSLEDALVAVDGETTATDDDLIAALSGAGPFTVFAPVNQGFTDMITANSQTTLGGFATAVGIGTVRTVLQYHVSTADPALDSTAVVGADGTSVTTLEGRSFTVDVDGATVTLNDGVAGVAGTNTSTVTVVDIITSNGIIHKLSKVITPPSAPVVETIQ